MEPHRDSDSAPPQAPAALALSPARIRLESTDALRAYLAEHDEPCPRCGYNLRGVDDPQCPECGHHLRLSLAGARTARGYLWFTLLALGWVLLASGMNATRAGLAAYREAQVNAFNAPVTFTVRALPGGTTVYQAPSVAASAPIVVQGRSASGSPRVIRLNAQSVQGQALLAPAIAPAAPGSVTLNLSQITPMTWTGLGFWSLLFLSSAVALLILALLWPRRGERTAPRGMVAAAGALFLLYAGYHTVIFVRELVA